MLDLWDWIVEGWNSLDFSDWFSGLNFGDVDTLVDAVDSGFDKLGSAVTNVASSLASGDAKSGVSPLVEGAVKGGESIAGEMLGYEYDFVGDQSWVKEVIGNVTKSDSTITGFWNSLGGKERAAILQAGLSGLAGGAAAYLQNKNKGKEIEASKELVASRGDQDRQTLQYRQDMNKVPTARPFKPAAPGTTPQIRRPSGQPVYDYQKQLGLIEGVM